MGFFRLLFALLLVFLAVTCHGAEPPPDEVLYGHECGFFQHFIPVRDQNCVGELPVFSCAGRCASQSVPRVYYSRASASIDTFYGCKCCTVTRRLMTNAEVEVTCPDNSTRLIRHFAVTATECSCATCA